MSIPNARVRKGDGATGVVRPGSKGICAIIAPCQQGTALQPLAVTRSDIAVTTFGYGELTEDASYILDIAGNPVLLVRVAASTVGAYAAIGLTFGRGARSTAPIRWPAVASHQRSMAARIAGRNRSAGTSPSHNQSATRV